MNEKEGKMSDQTAMVVAAIGTINVSDISAIVAAVVNAVAIITAAILNYRAITHLPTKHQPKLHNSRLHYGGLESSLESFQKTHAKEVERSAKWKRDASISLIVFAVSGAIAIWFAWLSQWGIYVAVAGRGALVAAIFVIISAIATVFYEVKPPARLSLAKALGPFCLIISGAAFIWFAFGPRAGISEISITQVPLASSKGNPSMLEHIGGNVSGVNPAKFRIVIYAQTNRWYVQPFAQSPTASSITGIKNDGTWGNDTHLGMQYAALLVKPTFEPPEVVDALPSVGGEVIVSTNEAGK